MPAPFATSLCGYRDKRPNTSDASDKGSIELGIAFFEAMGVTHDASPPDSVGNLMAAKLAVDLDERLAVPAPHLAVRPELPLTQFEQYAHLSSSKDLRSDMSANIVRAVTALDHMAASLAHDGDALLALAERKEKILEEIRIAEQNRLNLLNVLGEESLLKLDITVSRRARNIIDPARHLDHLVAGFSLKWSLRTDRAQDCRSQGAKMAALRRGRMPHFAKFSLRVVQASLSISINARCRKPAACKPTAWPPAPAQISTDVKVSVDSTSVLHTPSQHPPADTRCSLLSQRDRHHRDGSTSTTTLGWSSHVLQYDLCEALHGLGMS